MIRKTFAVLLAAAALPAAAQITPATNYTDLWDNSWNQVGTNPNPNCPGGESGWGITLTQHDNNSAQPPTHTVAAVWYTYDPRQPDSSNPGNYKPLWIIMPGGTWTSPTVFTGNMYVTVGTPFGQPWGYPSGVPITKIGTFTFTFSNNSSGTFQYNVAPPAGLASTDPAFGLPSFSGSKPICRETVY